MSAATTTLMKKTARRDGDPSGLPRYDRSTCMPRASQTVFSVFEYGFLLSRRDSLITTHDMIYKPIVHDLYKLFYIL